MNNKFRMDSQLFYLINFLFAAIFLFWFLRGRDGGGRKPTRLDLRAQGPQPTTKAVLQKDAPPPPRSAQNTPPTAKESSAQQAAEPRFRDVTHTTSQAESVIKTKQKRVLFMYNGHDWDAFEILGVGPSTPLPDITKKYQELVKTSDQGQLEFFECAYKAVLKNY